MAGTFKRRFINTRFGDVRKDVYGRFGVWGGDSGADRMGRGSLDDVLRNDSKMASIIAVRDITFSPLQYLNIALLSL